MHKMSLITCQNNWRSDRWSITHNVIDSIIKFPLLVIVSYCFVTMLDLFKFLFQLYKPALHFSLTKFLCHLVINMFISFGAFKLLLGIVLPHISPTVGKLYCRSKSATPCLNLSIETHQPSRSILEQFGTVWFDSLHVYIKPEINLV